MCCRPGGTPRAACRPPARRHGRGPGRPVHGVTNVGAEHVTAPIGRGTGSGHPLRHGPLVQPVLARGRVEELVGAGDVGQDRPRNGRSARGLDQAVDLPASTPRGTGLHDHREQRAGRPAGGVRAAGRRTSRTELRIPSSRSPAVVVGVRGRCAAPCGSLLPRGRAPVAVGSAFISTWWIVWAVARTPTPSACIASKPASSAGLSTAVVFQAPSRAGTLTPLTRPTRLSRQQPRPGPVDHVSCPGRVAQGTPPRFVRAGECL